MVKPVAELKLVIRGVRLKFEKSSPKWRIMRRRSKIYLIEFFNFCWRYPKYLELSKENRRTKEKGGRPPGRPTCTRCTMDRRKNMAVDRPIDHIWYTKSRSIARSTECSLRFTESWLQLCMPSGRPSGRLPLGASWPPGRPTIVFCNWSWIRTRFLIKLLVSILGFLLLVISLAV